jgi:hypothetical protein
MRHAGWFFLAGLLLAACSDETSEDGARDAAAPRSTRDATRTPEPGDAAVEADAAPVADAAPADAQVPAPDAAECATDDTCGDGRVCHRGQCIDGTRCATPDECPAGHVCVANLCFPDPQATGGIVPEPDRLVFTFSDAGDQVQRTTFLNNRTELPVDLTDIRIEGAATFALENPPQLPLRVAPGRQVDVTVAFTADDRMPENAELVVETGAGAPARVALASDRKVTGGQSPCLRVAPARLDFGQVVRGHDAMRSFTLESCGQVPVRVNAIRRGRSIFGELPPTFQLTMPPPFPIVLNPGQRQQIDVTYSPRRAGLEGGFWEVLSNDPANGTQRVDVSAIATPPPLQEVELHVRLAWDTDATDVDLHVLAPNGQMWTCDGDVYFSNPQPQWGDPNRFEDDPFLDTDDVDGFGPENVNVQAPAPGTYRVLVHYWADHGGEAPDATVEILNFGQVIGRYGPVHLSNIDDTWEVVDIDFPGLAQRALGGVNVLPRGNLCGGFGP